MDTSGYQPGRHHAAPLLEPALRKRVRSAQTHDPMWQRPAPTTGRRGLEAVATLRRSVQLPASLQVVTCEETARLDEARRRIEFRPRHGFLHSTPVGRLRARRTTMP
jgi:hypothetical protein